VKLGKKNDTVVPTKAGRKSRHGSQKKSHTAKGKNPLHKKGLVGGEICVKRDREIRKVGNGGKDFGQKATYKSRP